MSENLQAVLTDEASEMASAKEGGSRHRLAAAGGILGAIAASACCIVPLTLIVFGVSGAWMANLRAIAPYQPILIVMTIAFLGYGFYLVYRKPRRVSADGAVCARPIVPNMVVRRALWTASFIVFLAISFPYWFPLLVPYLP